MTNTERAGVWARKIELTGLLETEIDAEQKTAIRAQISYCNEQLIQNKLDLPANPTPNHE